MVHFYVRLIHVVFENLSFMIKFVWFCTLSHVVWLYCYAYELLNAWWLDDGMYCNTCLNKKKFLWVVY